MRPPQRPNPVAHASPEPRQAACANTVRNRLSKCDTREVTEKWEVLVHVLAYDDRSRILLCARRTDAREGTQGSGTTWSLPCASIPTGQEPDETARLVAPDHWHTGQAPARRPVLLRAHTEPAPTVDQLRLLYAVHVPHPPVQTRADGALWWDLSELASLPLSASTSDALVRGWSHLRH